MSLFLLKPHVVGPSGSITSPDVIVDRLFVDGVLTPVSWLTHEIWQQVPKCESARAAYGVMALGGGALIMPAVVLSSGAVVAARKAWRLNNLDNHVGSVTLNGTTLSKLGLPSNEIESVGGSGDALPRGFLVVRTGGIGKTVELVDQKLERKLSHRVIFESVDEDQWGKRRPKPRYSVGPTQKEIEHFI